jgi:hypothetical protein
MESLPLCPSGLLMNSLPLRPLQLSEDVSLMGQGFLLLLFYLWHGAAT